MEFFTNTKAVRLKSHLNKYLTAADDQITTRQSRGGAARSARWLVELVETNPHVVRLKSCYGRYLAAVSDHYLLGVTGRRVVQTLPEDLSKDLTVEWQPIRDGFQVKMKAFDGSYLRANGGTPPWRNSVTHDCPHAAATHDWVVWDVEAVEVPEDEAAVEYWSMVASYSSVTEEISGLDICCDSPVSVRSGFSGAASPAPRWWFMKKILQRNHLSSPSISRTSAIDLFRDANAVRLKSVHRKYLIAGEDEVSVIQHRNGCTKSAKWFVEFVENSDTIIRLKSCHGNYLTASNHHFLLGATGRKVLQTLPPRLDSSVEWEPIRENGVVKLKTRYGHFLRANGGLPPWRNSITHDIPQRSATRDWIFWEVQVVEIQPPLALPPIAVRKEDTFATESSSSPSTSQSWKSASFSRQEWDSSFSSPPKGSEGRLIYYHIANEYGEIDSDFEFCIAFKGNEVSELAKRLEDEWGIDGLTVCTKSPLNGKLHPLRLHLPPNNATIHVIAVPPSSQVSFELEEAGTPW